MSETDNDRLHYVFDDKTTFNELGGHGDTPSTRLCGCVLRGDGEYVRYCSVMNPRVGTHIHRTNHKRRGDQ